MPSRRPLHHLQVDVAPESAVLSNDGNVSPLFRKQGEYLGSANQHAMQNRLHGSLACFNLESRGVAELQGGLSLAVDKYVDPFNARQYLDVGQ